MKQKGKFLILILILMIPLLFLQSDDKELFMGLDLGEARVKPNVMLLVDTSGSMNTVIFYPRVGVDGIQDTDDDGYQGKIQYEGTITGFGTDSIWYTPSIKWYSQWVLGTTGSDDNNWTGVYQKDGEDRILCGSTGQANLQVGDWIINREHSAVARIKTKTDCSPVEDTCGSWLDLEEREGAFPLGAAGNDYCLEVRSGCELRVVKLYGGIDHLYETRYPLNYLKWIFLHTTEEQRMGISHFAVHGTFDVTETPGEQLSTCSTQGTDYIRYVFTRMQVTREVACKIAEDSRYIVNLGMFQFFQSYGGVLHDPLHDMSELAAMVDYKKKVYNTLEGKNMTPVAEALADVWWYYRPGAADKPYLPVNLDTATSPVHDIEWWCQNNYCIVMTDGESTLDQFSGDKRFDGSLFNTYPVKRTDPWEDWSDGWGDPDNNEASSGVPSGYDPDTSIYCPNYSCWLRWREGFNYDGTDYLDDVAYFMANSDLFPEKNIYGDELYGDDPETGFPGKQAIYTYTIGFGIDNDLLRATAINGEGAYYTADNYEELINAFKSIITSILLRNFAFSAITAPKKTATASNTDQTISYVGYFMPSMASSIWEGHLAAYELFDKWGYDQDGNDVVDETEFTFASEEDCYNSSDGEPCQRLIQLSDELLWDAAWAGKIPENRNLWTLKSATQTEVEFDKANKDDFKDRLSAVDETEEDAIIDKIRLPNLADIFHSDVGFIGPPLAGKMFIPNVNPMDDSAEPYLDFYNNHEDRERVIYAGTNDGIFHMFRADDSTHVDMRDAGKEVWGFIPDEVLPSMRDIVINSQHTYTVDGRIKVEDIYFDKGSGQISWSTVLGLGLRRGGNYFYQMDITDVTDRPAFLWKFNHPTYSGQSWSRPIYGRVKYIPSGGDPEDLIEKWIVILTGGYAYNYENPGDLKGKALFIVDAANGSLLWMIGYDPVNGADIDGNQVDSNLDTVDDRINLTKADVFNFPVPSAVTAVDTDFDGYLDAVYFGNTGGNLFKVNLKSTDMTTWKDKVTLLYQSDVITEKVSTITAIADNLITMVKSLGYDVGDTIVGATSYAMGHITAMEQNKVLTVKMLSGAFIVGEDLDVKEYDPIFLSPAVAFDNCYNLWVAFATGDRDRPRTNTVAGNFVAFKDDNSVTVRKIGTSPLNVDFNDLWGDCVDPETGETYTCYQAPDDTTVEGFYFSFTGAGEKIFDPEPIIIPDSDLVPHIFFNTYTPPTGEYVKQDNPCNVPEEGTMIIYDIAISSCGFEISKTDFEGRISGGGVYGDQIVMFIGTPEIGSTPPLEETSSRKMPYPGGIVFWKEKKR
ncbi:MAG: hypothetical protein KAT34_05770 [Candidatus Aminicenantes bacterium]|nr:hypothetical protein [Candidatus Aminicenantes bacterium]